MVSDNIKKELKKKAEQFIDFICDSYDDNELGELNGTQTMIIGNYHYVIKLKATNDAWKDDKVTYKFNF